MKPTVLIPAYNEEAVIHRSLGPLCAAATAGQIEVIVLANGCKDATARVARQICPAAHVIEIGAASKTHAMNFGFAAATGDVIVCLDADLSLSRKALMALVRPLIQGEAEASCGRMIPDLGGSGRLVRSFYRAWALNPYFDRGKFGGVYAMTRRAGHRVFPMPEVVADDEYVARAVSDLRTAYVPDAAFTVTAPAGLKDLYRIRRRSRRGTAALEAGRAETTRPTNAASFATILKRAARHPARWCDVAVYAAVILSVRLGLKLSPTPEGATWERDESSRQRA